MQPFVTSKKVGPEENIEASIVFFSFRMAGRSSRSTPQLPVGAPGTQLDSTWIISELSALPPSLPSYKSLDSTSRFLLVQNFHR